VHLGWAPGRPVEGGVQEELLEIFRELNVILLQVGVSKNAIVSVRRYLADVNRDIAAANKTYAEYFVSHPPSRRAYGVTLQQGMQVGAAFVADLPE
jgi:enamine deaminase RidA (YjgF/YER057c/UK114 family)